MIRQTSWLRADVLIGQWRRRGMPFGREETNELARQFEEVRTQAAFYNWLSGFVHATLLYAVMGLVLVYLWR